MGEEKGREEQGGQYYSKSPCSVYCCLSRLLLRIVLCGVVHCVMLLCHTLAACVLLYIYTLAYIYIYIYIYIYTLAACVLL